MSDSEHTIIATSSARPTFKGRVDVDSECLSSGAVRLEVFDSSEGSQVVYLTHDEARQVAIALLTAVRKNRERSSE